MMVNELESLFADFFGGFCAGLSFASGKRSWGRSGDGGGERYVLAGNKMIVFEGWSDLTAKLSLL